MTERPLSVTATMAFILVNALVWLVFGVIMAANAHPALQVSPLIKEIMAIISFATAGLLIGSFIFVSRHNRMAYYIVLALLAATFLANFFDNIGLVDLVVIIINIIPIILLIKDRAWYLQRKSQTQGSV